MDNEDVLKIIYLIEHPDYPVSLKDVGILDYIKIEDDKIITIFALPDLGASNKKDLANSVRIMAESFGYKFEYDFRQMTEKEIINFKNKING